MSFIMKEAKALENTGLTQLDLKILHMAFLRTYVHAEVVGHYIMCVGESISTVRGQCSSL